MHISIERANYLISRTDKYRAKYYSYYTGGKDWTNPVNYDMALNSDRIGKEKCVQIIKEYKETFLSAFKITSLLLSSIIPCSE